MLKYLVVIIRATFLPCSHKNKYWEMPLVGFMCDSRYTSNLCYNLITYVCELKWVLKDFSIFFPTKNS